MSLLVLVKNINSDASADAVVRAIYEETVPSGPSQVEKIKTYFEDSIRKPVFKDGTTTGRYVTLSDPALRLGDAFLRRYQDTGEFVPTLAYHKTSSFEIANLIVSGGFNAANSTIFGYGIYFFLDPQKAEEYIPQGRPPNEITDVVLMVTIYSRLIPKGPDPFPVYGTDAWTYQPTAGVLVVKNPLVVFPRAVIRKGEVQAWVRPPPPVAN